MNTKIVVILLAAAIMLSSTVLPNAAFAADTALAVKKNDATCSPTATIPCFGTIQGAIDYISNQTVTITTFSIQVEAGEYTEAVILGPRITSLKGKETARTVLTGSGSGTLITINGGAPIISNLYFQNATNGIEITNSATATIQNNIFNLGLSGTAIQLSASSAQTSISKNTFHSNNVAISGSIALPVKNNIFHANTTIPALPATPASDSLVAYNDFFANTSNPSIAPEGDAAGNRSADPLFVASTIGDFHLKVNSPCIKSGLTSTAIDMGAYGDTSADTIPFQVSGVTVEQIPPTSAKVNWNKNLDHKVIGYRVWYGKTSGGPYNGTEATEGASPLSVPTGTFESAYTLNGLSAEVITPAGPVLYAPTPLNESLSLSWSPVAGATRYKVYWSDSSFDLSSLPSTSLDVGNTTATILTGLINGANYHVAVTAIAEAAYYITVTSIYSAVSPSPGISNESIYSVQEPVGAGEIKESALSNIQIDFPEALAAYPNLPDSGKNCFIATTAYGHYSTPQVQALRTFRDRYLLTNGPGSAFVRWYYKHGPVAAAWLDAHPLYKPMVRAALLPAVGAALFFTGTTFFVKAVVTLFLLVLVLMVSYRTFRKRLSASGGAH